MADFQFLEKTISKTWKEWVPKMVIPVGKLLSREVKEVTSREINLENFFMSLQEKGYFPLLFKVIITVEDEPNIKNEFFIKSRPID